MKTILSKVTTVTPTGSIFDRLRTTWVRIAAAAAAVLIALVGMLATPAVAAPMNVCTWNSSGSTDLNNPANYTPTSGTCTSLVGAQLVFPPTIPGSGATLALTADLSVDDIVLNNSYNIEGSSYTLTLSGGDSIGTGVAVDATAGDSTISANVAAASYFLHLEVATDASLDVSGTVSVPNQLFINDINGGSGTVRLSADNTASLGDYALIALYHGTLEVGNDNALGNWGVDVLNGSVLALDTGISVPTTVSVFDLGGTLEALGDATWAGPVALGGSGSPAATLAASSGSVLTVSGSISFSVDASNSMIVGKSGGWDGTVMLSGSSNVWYGGTTVAYGTLKDGANEAVDSHSPLDVKSGATLDLNGLNQSFQTVSGTGTITDSIGGGTLTFASLTETYTVTPTLTGGLNLYAGPNGGTTITLAAGNSYTGSTIIGGTGVVIINDGTALGDTSGVTVGDPSRSMNGDLTLNGTMTLSMPIYIPRGIVEVTGTSSTATLAGPVTIASDASTHALAAAADDILDVQGSVTETGTMGSLTVGASGMSGTVILADSSSSVWSTEITAGTLDLSGTLSGAITVDSGATLEGTGTLVGGIGLYGGTLMPGATSTPGLLTTGSVVTTSGSAVRIYLAGANAGSEYSQLASSGDVSLNGNLDVAVDPSYTATVGTTFDVVTARNVSNNFANAPSGTILTVGGQSFQISYTGSAVVLTAVAPGTAPSAPTLDSATSGNGSVTLNWTEPSDTGGSPIDGYNVYVGTTSGGESPTPANSSLITGTSTDITGLANGTTYYFEVTAVNHAGLESDPSNEMAATPTTTTPSAPTLDSATSGNGSVTLNWTEPADNGGSAIVGYNVYMGTTSGGESSSPENSSLITGTSTDITGLVNGTMYYFEVTAVNGVGESERSNEVFATPLTTPSAPPSVSAIPADGSVTLTWSAPSDNGGALIDGYNVYVGTSSGGESPTPENGSLITGTSYDVTGLTNGTTYYFEVTAINDVGESDPSTEVSATPVATVTAPSTTTAYVANFGSGAVSAVDTVTGTVIATIPVVGPSCLYTVTVNPAGTYAYVPDSCGHTVSVIDTSSNTVTDTITVGADPEEVAFNPDGTYAYVTNSDGTVSVIDTSDNTVSATITVGAYPIGVAVDPDGTHVYVANASDRTVSVIDTSSNTVTDTITVGLGPQYVAVDPAGTHVYVTNYGEDTVSVIDTSDNTVSATINVPSAYDLAFTPDGGTLYVTLDGYQDPTTSQGAVAVIDPSDNTVVDEITDPGLIGSGGIAISPDGSFAYVADPEANDMAVIDTADNSFSYLTAPSSFAAPIGVAIGLTQTAPITAPSAPTGVSATAGDGSVTLNWTAPFDDGGSPISGYNVYVGTTSGGESSSPENSSLITGTSTDITGLTNGTTYYFVVTAVNEADLESASSTEVSATPAASVTVPSAPTNAVATVEVTGHGKDKTETLELTWSEPTDNGGSAITGYVIDVYTFQPGNGPNSGYTLVTTIDTGSGSTDYSVSDSDLAGPDFYAFTVAGENSAGTGAYSDDSNIVRY